MERYGTGPPGGVGSQCEGPEASVAGGQCACWQARGREEAAGQGLRDGSAAASIEGREAAGSRPEAPRGPPCRTLALEQTAARKGGHGRPQEPPAAASAGGHVAEGTRFCWKGGGGRSCWRPSGARSGRGSQAAGAERCGLRRGDRPGGSQGEPRLDALSPRCWDVPVTAEVEPFHSGEATTRTPP